MRTATYLEHREDWRVRAPLAAARLRAADPGPARALLAGWRIGEGEADLVLDQLRRAPPVPDPRAWTLALGEPPPVTAATAVDWRELAWQRAAPAEGGDPLAWGLAELAAFAWLVEQAERLPWQDMAVVRSPADDDEVAGLWAAWASGRPWMARDAWERRFLKPALRAFAAVVRGRRLPEQVRTQALQDAREGFFFALLGDGKTGAGWRELAVRLLEAAGPDPVDALATALPAESWERVARCAVTRGHGRETAALVWGRGLPWQVAARALQRQGQERPQALGELLDLHLALRLVESWTEAPRTAPGRGLAVVTHNHGRARSRLRAVLREAPAEHLLARLTALPGLAARTRVAVARFARDWAWQQVQYGFSYYDARTIDPACLLPEGAAPPFTPDDLQALRAWVLLVVLKGRLRHLRQWVHGGAEVDARDSTWGRLLSDDCPPALREVQGATRAEALARLRAELSDRLGGLLRELRPTLVNLANLSEGRGPLKPAFEAAIAPTWHPSVAQPQVQYRRYVAAAREALALLDAGHPEPEGEA